MKDGKYLCVRREIVLLVFHISHSIIWISDATMVIMKIHVSCGVVLCNVFYLTHFAKIYLFIFI